MIEFEAMKLKRGHLVHLELKSKYDRHRLKHKTKNVCLESGN